MSTQNNDVSVLVNQAFNSTVQMVDMKKQLFDLSDEFSLLFSSYDSLQVITAACGADAENVGAVLYGLNRSFEVLVEKLDLIRK